MTTSPYCFLELRFLFIDLFLLQEIVGYLSFFSSSSSSSNLSVYDLSPFKMNLFFLIQKKGGGKGDCWICMHTFQCLLSFLSGYSYRH